MNGEPGKYKGTATKLPQYIAALSVCLGSVAAGTVLGWTANIDDALKSKKLNDISIDEEASGWIGSLVPLGSLFMCFPIGYICDKIGRKWAMISTLIPFMVGWLLIIFSSNVEMIYAGRFLTGMAGAAFCVAAPMYTSEIAQDEIRGTLGTFFQLLLVVGILISYILGKFLEVKTFTYVVAAIPIVFAVVFFFQPETPVYLVKTGKYDEAVKSLKRLRGSTYDSRAEMEDIKAALAKEAEINMSFSEAVRSKASKKALMICFGLMLFQQLSGVNAFIFYTSKIFTDAGSTIPPQSATIYVGLVQLAATFSSSLVIDKFGRKILLLISDFFMMLSGFTLALYFTLKDRHIITKETAETIGFLPIASLIVFMLMFSIGFGPIPWLASAEIFPPEIKSTASAAAATFNWFLAFLVTKFYSSLSETVGSDVTLYLFAGVSLVGTIFVYFLVPETKGKSTAQIQAELSGIDNPAFEK